MQIRLRELREQKGMTQSDLAKVLKKSLRTIQSWENGESFPNADVIWKCADYFATDPNEVLGWYEDHPHDEPDYRDPRQSRLNMAFAALDERSKSDLEGVAMSFAADPSRRASKSGQGGAHQAEEGMRRAG